MIPPTPALPHQGGGGSALVTGATGFLGGAVARRLAREGRDVLGIGRNADAGAALERDGVRFRAVDLEDSAAVRDAARGVALVVHCAALSSPFGTEDAFFRANVVGTRHVVAAAAGARLVHVSTPSVYHTGRDRLAIREDEPLRPRDRMTSYARTKAAAEDLVRGSRLPHVILRPRAIFGPGDTTLLPRLTRALASGRLPVIGSRDTVVDLTHVDNVVDAILLAAERGEGTYNVSNGEPVRVWDLIGDLARALDLPPPRGRIPRAVALAAARASEAFYRRFRPGVEPPVTSYGVAVVSTSVTLDLTAIRRDLGYAPSVSLADGIARFVDWARSHPESWR